MERERALHLPHGFGGEVGDHCRHELPLDPVEADETPNVLVDGVADTCGFGVCGEACKLRDVIEWM
jgi:hypothetical protein